MISGCATPPDLVQINDTLPRRYLVPAGQAQGYALVRNAIVSAIFSREFGVRRPTCVGDGTDGLTAFMQVHERLSCGASSKNA